MLRKKLSFLAFLGLLSSIAQGVCPTPTAVLQGQIRGTEAQITTDVYKALLLNIPKTVCTIVKLLYADQQSVALPSSLVFACATLMQQHYHSRFCDNQVKLQQRLERLHRRRNPL